MPAWRARRARWEDAGDPAKSSRQGALTSAGWRVCWFGWVSELNSSPVGCEKPSQSRPAARASPEPLRDERGGQGVGTSMWMGVRSPVSPQLVQPG